MRINSFIFQIETENRAIQTLIHVIFSPDKTFSIGLKPHDISKKESVVAAPFSYA